jgi:adenylate cyclase class 2
LESSSTKASLTYKGPRLKSDLKVRGEINIDIDDAGSGCELLKALGYVEFLFFQKRRESWRLGECQIELDEMPHLGKFIEIEGPNEQEIRKLQGSLGLSDIPVITKSYITLLVEYCQKKGIPASRITFESG